MIVSRGPPDMRAVHKWSTDHTLKTTGVHILSYFSISLALFYKATQMLLIILFVYNFTNFLMSSSS